MTAEPLDTLPDSGRYVVETVHSAYLIDTDAKTSQRWPAAPEASTFDHDASERSFTEIRCVTNASMRLYFADGQFMISTPVESITAAKS